jgi:hypothetical protein
MAYRPRFFCRSDGYRVSASNLTAKTCPPIELLPMALDRCHASFQVDGPDYVGISPWLFPMINLVQLLSNLTVLVLSGNLDGIQRSLTLLLSIITALLFNAIFITATTTVLAINDKYTLVCFLLTEIANRVLLKSNGFPTRLPTT